MNKNKKKSDMNKKIKGTELKNSNKNFDVIFLASTFW